MSAHSPTFHCFVVFLFTFAHTPTRLSEFYLCNLLVPLYLSLLCWFLFTFVTHLPIRLSGFYLGNLLVPLYLCVQDVITDETIEQQGYEDWVCSFPNICFYIIT